MHLHIYNVIVGNGEKKKRNYVNKYLSAENVISELGCIHTTEYSTAWKWMNCSMCNITDKLQPSGLAAREVLAARYSIPLFI